MSSRLTAAVDLYRRLVRNGPDDAGDVADAAALAELLALGLARRVGRRVVPVPLSPAIKRLLGAELHAMSARHEALSRAYQQLMQLSEAMGGYQAGGAWRVLAGAEAACLAAELGGTARTSCSTCGPRPPCWPPPCPAAAAPVWPTGRCATSGPWTARAASGR